MESNDNLEQLLRQMYANEEVDTSKIIDEEWQKFESKYFAPKQRLWDWRKIAATIVGILMLSGISYAAIQWWGASPSPSEGGDVEMTTQSSGVSGNQTAPPLEESVETSADTIRIFSNTPLDEMVNEMATYYNKVVENQSTKAHDLRLYYKWNRNDGLESVISDLNHFEKVDLAIEGDKLIVNP
ncbi:MAG: DUF4974 domain-containing protein [Prevotella sp.]|nr:DUF4974 domain-containing protein [Prevotella sp.]